jgi:lipopolysaccharide transport system ATP-binding protein
MNNLAIKVSGIGKAYRIGLKEERHDTIGALLASWIKSPISNFRRLRKLGKILPDSNDSDIFWALKEVAFEVKRGEVIGIIGRNGAGKSTLLKILSRVTDPTTGIIDLYGRVASLLEVGTGFNPELTGRENVFLNGTILGMTRKEVESKFDEIIEFSGIQQFIDTPIKRYSSGMKVRLAFAVAAHLDPEILIIDEVLAVGDFEFQKKCLNKMQDISANNGRTILFVSHDMAAVKALCTRAIMLENGMLTRSGTPHEVINYYLSESPKGPNRELKTQKFAGNGDWFADGFELLNSEGYSVQTVQTGSQISLRIFYKQVNVVSKPVVVLIIKDLMDKAAFFCFSKNSHSKPIVLKDEGYFDIYIPKLPLLPGVYNLELTLKYDSEICYQNEFFGSLEVEKGDFFGTGKLNDNLVQSVLVDHSWSFL